MARSSGRRVRMAAALLLLAAATGGPAQAGAESPADAQWPADAGPHADAPAGADARDPPPEMTSPPAPELTESAAAKVLPTAIDGPPQVEAETDAVGAATRAPAPLVITGYIDVGFAAAQGDGTSFRPGDNRAPADYGVDPFAPAVNSRGEVASTDPGTDPSGNPRFVNGFLPRSAGIGGTPSFLLNTASVDLRYSAPELPVMVFTRVQLMPRLESTGETTRLLLEQAFGRINPLGGAELAISVGKVDSVFGIEYLENQANFRVGITPSLFARYTTGPSVGVKVFYRYRLIPLASAISVNMSATNSGTFVEALQGPSRSLTGVPVGAGRLGYDLELPRAFLRLGASGAYGPRNDQLDRNAHQALFGLDLRCFFAGFTLSGEYLQVREQEGSADLKLTGTGSYPFASQFYASGFWLQLGYERTLPVAPWRLAGFRVTPYLRYERRHGEFEDFASIVVDRITAGVNVGLGDNLQIKGEYLVNRELQGAPVVPNNVLTSSVVWTW